MQSWLRWRKLERLFQQVCRWRRIRSARACIRGRTTSDILKVRHAEALHWLARLELFAGLPEDALASACAKTRIERLPRNVTVFEQGARAVRGYAVAEGSVRITQGGRDGGQAVIRFIAPGEMFGTVPLFTDHLLPADATTAEPSTVLSWSEADLLLLMEAYPRISLNVIRVIGTRILELQDRVRELATQRAEQRLARALLRLSGTARDGVGTSGAIGFPLRRKDLAEFSGTTLHTASRTLAAWEKAGILSRQGQTILIHNCVALGMLAEGDG